MSSVPVIEDRWITLRESFFRGGASSAFQTEVFKETRVVATFVDDKPQTTSSGKSLYVLDNGRTRVAKLADIVIDGDS